MSGKDWDVLFDEENVRMREEDAKRAARPEAIAHTTGPWVAIRRRDGIAVSGVGVVLYGSGREADARLVAAAPELLAALTKLVADIERAAAAGVDLTGHVGLGDALTAIAKARGNR